MTDLAGIAPPLAAALSERGYETLTAVQLAVLAEGVAGRDLLVSAQTGSGKTVAFGLAIAPDLLAADPLAGTAPLPPAAAPLALVVAPTRELALQVRREFEWLYAGAGAAIASCVGGMDYRGERRALERGAHIVVGTPGRLRDHIERGALDLSGLRVVVLDEADEMLDLGFSEDLEFLLAAAPAERRVLMFSATVPPAIEALAASFQRDALRLRTSAETRQHADIDYQCFSVAQGDREHAIINVLRFYEAERAIVFCKTRAEVAHLLGRFHNRGFQVVALSGELSQTERLHALQAVRDGRARICVATDVAARGIDLPGLELVIHADLPQNPEALLHRSGRTGRAGRRGVSALIVTPRDLKRAQRLLQAAKLQASWGPAPSAEAVLQRDEARLLDAAELTGAVGEDEASAVAALTARHGAESLAAAFLRLWRAGRSAPEEIASLAPPAAPAPGQKRDLQAFGESVWYSLSAGHEDRAEARWILPKLCDHGRIPRAEIGAIRVQRNLTFIQIAAAAAPAFEQALGTPMQIEPGLELSRLDTAPNLERPLPRGRLAEERSAPRPKRPAQHTQPEGRGRAPQDAPRSGPREAPWSAPSKAPAKSPAKAPWKATREAAPDRAAAYQAATPKATPAEAPSPEAAPDGRPAKKQRWSAKQKEARAAAPDKAERGPAAKPKRPAGAKTAQPGGKWGAPQGGSRKAAFGKGGDRPPRHGGGKPVSAGPRSR